MTTVYMIRNAECENPQDMNSAITEVGKKEIKALEAFFMDKAIDTIYVSSNKSATDTMNFLTVKDEIAVYVSEELKERVIGPRVANIESFSRRQWEEVEYKLPGGESYLEVQNRMIDALEKVVTIEKDKTNIICSHGMALATVIQFFDGTFSVEEYLNSNKIRPFIIKMKFNDKTLISLELIRCM